MQPEGKPLEAALGTEEGTARMLCPEEGSQISSLSERWIEAVRESNRFEGHSWDKKITVRTTSLDRLIELHGLPAFCKIDVEGYEPEVLEGLSRPVPALSFEYTPEYSGHVTGCVAELSRVGEYRYNFVVHGLHGGRHRFEWAEWLTAGGALARLEGPESPELRKGGDVYARLAGATPKGRG